jgi:hypothetical protein
MKHKIITGILCSTVAWICQAVQTQVQVEQGKVKVETSTATTVIAAGQKGTLAAGKDPLVTVNEPMVNDMLEILKWIEQEKNIENPPFKASSIQIYGIDDDQLWKLAALYEGKYTDDKPLETLKIGLTSILEEPQYYDLRGNLLNYDLQRVTESKGYYHIHFSQPIQPGERVTLICVSKYRPQGEGSLWKEGNLWYVQMGNDSRDFLNYYRVTLPETAILVDCSRPILITDITGGRTTITIRNLTGAEADGQYVIAFLWPAKDGTTLKDLPPQYRGLRDSREVKLTQEYRTRIEEIICGGSYNDQSTPLAALITNNGALATGNMDLFIQTTSPALHLADKFRQMDTAQRQTLKHQFVDTQEFLSTPPWPDKPQEHYIHPIYVARKGSLIREDTLACIYENGKWYRFGNMGNSRMTDVSSFIKWLSPSPYQAELDALPWDKAGPDALEVYRKFLSNSNIGPNEWFTLGIKMVGGGYYVPAFDAFQRCEQIPDKASPTELFAAMVWQGHLYDLQGKRPEAIQKYNSALAVKDYGPMRHDQWHIALTYQWVQDRLKEPFTAKMIGK